jgi:hypothetical protein
MKIFPQNLRSSSRYNPSAYAKRLGIPHIVDSGLLTSSAYNYSTPYFHAFLVERPQALATS